MKNVLFALLLTASSSVCFADSFDYAGLSDGLALALPLTAAALSVAHHDSRGLSQLVKSEAVTLGVTEVLKRTTNVERPNQRDNKSFPSGHTSTAFAAAQYMYTRGGKEYGIPAYIVASLVGYSRVKANEHRWTDVLAGAAIGISSSLYFTDKRPSSGWSFFGGPDGAYAQYSATWK